MKQAAEKLKLWTGCRGLHPRLQGQTDRARVQMEEQADIRTTVKQVDRKMGCIDSRDRVKVNSSYEMTDRLMGGAVMAGPGPGTGVTPFPWSGVSNKFLGLVPWCDFYASTGSHSLSSCQ